MIKIILLMFFFVTCDALADSSASDNLSQLKEKLSMVREEQQSVYQNYQMLKELRLNEVQEGSQLMIQHPYSMGSESPIPNYNDVTQAQIEREDRIQQYTIELTNLLSHFLELENQRKSLIKLINEQEQYPAQ